MSTASGFSPATASHLPINLPDGSDLDAIRRIRAPRARLYPTVPPVIPAASASEHDRIRGLNEAPTTT
jgi:hypothetical protein